MDFSSTNDIYVAISFFGSCSSTHYGSMMAKKYLDKDFLATLNIVALNDPKATHYISFDHSGEALRAVRRQVPVSRRLLLAFEPKAVNPAQYRSAIRAEYSKTVVGSRRHILSTQDRFINHGYMPSSEVIRAEMAFLRGERKGIGMLNENKYSFVRGNQYRTRVVAARELAAAGLHVTIGGKNWQRSKLWQISKQLESAYACIKLRGALALENFHWAPRDANLTFPGQIPSEIDFLSSFEFSLVIENDPDYISEKLFNAIRARTVPLYVGPPLIEFGLPSDIAIPVSGLRSSFINAIRACSELERKSILAAGERLLQEQLDTGVWLEETTVRHMSAEIGKFLGKSG